MEVINTNIKYTIEVDDLTSGSYAAHLWDKESGTIKEVDGVADDGLYVFTFSAADTSAFEDGQIVTLEIYEKADRKAIYYKDRFARIRKTAVPTPSTNTTTLTANEED